MCAGLLCANSTIGMNSDYCTSLFTLCGHYYCFRISIIQLEGPYYCSIWMTMLRH